MCFKKCWIFQGTEVWLRYVGLDVCVKEMEVNIFKERKKNYHLSFILLITLYGLLGSIETEEDHCLCISCHHTFSLRYCTTIYTSFSIFRLLNCLSQSTPRCWLLTLVVWGSVPPSMLCALSDRWPGPWGTCRSPMHPA